MQEFERGSRSRAAREGGYLGRKRNYKCRRCGVKFKADVLNPLPEKERVCTICRGKRWRKKDSIQI